jgi:formate-dependent phosphoribosylglycinamide formyltransferase (GAR transformylase)
LCTTCRWISTARLAIALSNAGCRVEAVCPGGHPITRTRAVHHRHGYNAFAPLRSITVAMERARPDLIIPCDDLATAHLHHLHGRAVRSGQALTSVRTLIESSLGDPAHYSLIGSRRSFLTLARNKGIRVPDTEIVESVADLERSLGRVGYPAVLKADGTSGGVGVRIVQSFGEAQQAFRLLKAPPLAARAVKRAIFDRDRTLLLPSLVRKRRVVSVQGFVSGREATIALACWQGRILASISVEVLNTWKPGGPASVVRLIDNFESAAAETMVGTLGLSGLCGFDFMIEDSTDHAYLLEMNPRSTQICHLPLGVGRDLPAALHSTLTGEPLPETASVTDGDTIALFPQEWQQNPSSEFLRSAYHDVPWSEPELVRACVRRHPLNRLLSWRRAGSARTERAIPENPSVTSRD